MRNAKLFLFGALLLTTAALAGCGEKKLNAEDPANAPHVAVVKVARQNLTSTLEIASEFQPFQEIDVYAKVAGYIQKLNVDWGTHVKQGQVLAVLEIPELQQQVQQDEAAVRRSEQDLARSREDLTRVQSAYSVAHVTYQRLADVQKTRPELMAQQEVDVAQGKDAEAAAGVSAAKDSQAAAEEGIASAKALLEKDQAMFAYARIVAPFDGVVTRIDAYKGALLPAGTSTNAGNSALCHLSQNEFVAARDSGAREGGARHSRRRKRGGGSVGIEKNVQRADRADSRIRSTPRRGRCTRNWMCRIRLTSWCRACMRR